MFYSISWTKVSKGSSLISWKKPYLSKCKKRQKIRFWPFLPSKKTLKG